MRSHDQISNGALTQPTTYRRSFSSALSTATSTPSIFNSFPSFSMPTLRFPGDGLDFRRPAITAPVQNPQDIIDLTDDHSPEVQRPTRPFHRANPRTFIDVDELSTRATVDSSSQSPDLELLEVRAIRSDNNNRPEPRRSEHSRPRSILRPPGSSHPDNEPFAVGGWNSLRPHAQGHRNNDERLPRLHHLLHTPHLNPRHEMLLMHQNRNTILPGDLDFVTQGFQMGDVTARPPPPALPTYDAPPPAREGFTRSPKEDDVLLCPNCEEELGTGKDDSKRQVWVIKACGHLDNQLKLEGFCPMRQQDMLLAVQDIALLSAKVETLGTHSSDLGVGINVVNDKTSSISPTTLLPNMSEERPAPPPLTKGEVVKEYLTAYNSVCALLWLSVLGRVVVVLPITGVESVYEAAGDFTKWTQTVAILEILHSAFGLVRSPLPTTILQVASRILLVWAVVNQFPAATSTSPFYSSMLIAWSATEVVRYSYFVLNLRGSVPGFLTWLRYNMFYVLYPVGITSEAVLVWRASEAAGEPWKFVGWGVLGLYIPGSYVLYTYMIAQRRKVMKGKQAERRN
ncbi:MAG: hypothetical protein Q9169_004706 [Polycauliona sp. 2 TL-2023]